MKGKVVFITGSSVGIGRETAYKFAECGAKLVVTYYKDEKEAKLCEKKCGELGAQDTIVINLDVMDNDSIRNAVASAAKKYGRIDILVNNAGVMWWKPIEKQSFEEIEKQVRTNLEGLIKMTKEALHQGAKTVINISSGAGKTGFSSLAPYCATKFGVRGFTQSMIAESGKARFISVNPGMTATKMTGYRGDPPQKVAEIILKAAKGEIKPDRYGDIDVWEFI